VPLRALSTGASPGPFAERPDLTTARENLARKGDPNGWLVPCTVTRERRSTLY